MEKKDRLKTIKIKDKDYVTVAERVRYFNEAYPKGVIKTEIVKHENGLILMRAIVIPDIEKDTRCFTGYAQEEKGKGLVNTQSYVENCETSAVGRALGFLGIGVEIAIRSADEMANVALQNGDNNKSKIATPEALSESSQESKDKPQPNKNSKPKPEVAKPTKEQEPPLKPQSNGKSLTKRFEEARKSLGDADYFFILEKQGFKSISEIKIKAKAEEILKAMEEMSGTKEIEEMNLDDK